MSYIRKFVALLFSICANSSGADLLLNEWSAVDPGVEVDGRDFTLGEPLGNGGNWCELVVVGDHVDIRGWQLQWAELSGNDPTNGTDYWIGDGSTKQGVITFSQSPVWKDLRSGTIITIAESFEILNEDAQIVVSGSDASFNPDKEDWWIHVCTFANAEMTIPESELLSAVANLPSDGAGSFEVSESDWVARIIDASGVEVQGMTGEGAPSWRGGTELINEDGGSLRGPGTDGTLEDWQGILPSSDLYWTTGSTSFGAPNAFYNGIQGTFTIFQDFSVLREIGSRIIAPAICSITKTPSGISVTWESHPGEEYQLEMSVDLLEWETVPGGPIPSAPDKERTSVDVSLSLLKGFVRVSRL